MPLPAFLLRLGDSDVFAVQLDIIEERPVIYYAPVDKEGGQYLAYRVSNGVEEVFPSEGVGNATFSYSPLLHIDKLPPLLVKSARTDKTKKAGYIPIRLKDMASLAKVAAYKTLYEEPPLPLFYFSDGKKRALGAAMSMNDNDSISYFYYVEVDAEPKEPFMRYSSQKSEPTTFSSRLDDHGYIYLKLIKLAGDHPLVKLYD